MSAEFASPGYSSQFPVLGILRFSFFGPTDTRQKHRDEADLATLYDPERMETRFNFFEKLLLPSIKAQTDGEFDFAVVSSDVMPKIYKERLADGLSGFSQARLILAETQSFRKVAGPLILAACEASRSGNVATFRVDDDDALSRHYIRRLRDAALGVPPKSVITFPKSVGMFREADGSLGVTKRMLLCASPGLCRINNAQYAKDPYAMMHGGIWRRFLTLSDPGFLSHIQSYHTHNDTAANTDQTVAAMKRSIGRKYKSEEYWAGIRAALAEDFPSFDLQYLADAFGASLNSRQESAAQVE
ncbi:MAG: glycosyltransferase [Albidovulum sp.]|uniref:glycosyltransferase n=1 Tax=Albidovulum sp. TaxID=1872424 RepID=UPI003C886626